MPSWRWWTRSPPRLYRSPLSSHHGEGAAEPGLPGLKLIAFEPTTRAWLHQRIEQRFDAMLEAGFMAEVQALRARGDLHPGLPSMRCVGYRQAWEALESGDLTALRDRAVAATRQLAKRQLTWLRSMPERQVIACDAPDVCTRLQHFVSALRGP
jgi:tRNA dimethylallyltransferase